MERISNCITGANTMKTKPYTIKGSLVKDHIRGYSYQLNTRIDAEHLCRTLTEYETEKQNDINYEKIRQQIIALQMDISNCQADLNKIKELIQ